MQPANENICTFSTILDQLQSLVGVSFHAVSLCTMQSVSPLTILTHFHKSVHKTNEQTFLNTLAMIPLHLA